MRTLYLDIETTIDFPSKDGLLLVGWALDDGPVYTEQEPSAELLRWLSHPDVVKVTHTKYDLRYLMLAGFDVAGDLHDTAVMAHTMNENTPLDLDWLTWRYAGLSMDKRLRRVAGRVVFKDDRDVDWDLADWEDWKGLDPWAEFMAYCGRDVEALRKLYLRLRERLEESEWWPVFLSERVPYTNTLLRMETRGLPVNLEATAELADRLRVEKDRLGLELLAEAGLPPTFNLNSGDQLAAYLFSRVLDLKDRLPMDTDPLPSDQDFVIEKVGRLYIEGHWVVKGRGLKPTPPTTNKVTGEKGKRPSTASPELLYMHAGDPWVRKLCLEYRKLEKLLTTYLTKWPVEAVEGRLYGRFNQTGTVTGRLSSSGPNLQNIPARGALGKEVRGLFQGELVVGDYDQLEMRLMAHFSQDRHMLEVFRAGKDPHLITAQGIFGMGIDPDGDERGIGKTLNFAMGYGAGPKKVAQVLSLAGYPTTKEVAVGYLAEMSRFYKGFFTWKKHVMETAKRRGHVATIGGGRRRLKATFKDTANWKLVGYGERQAVNAVVQGSAADIIRRAMVAYDQTLWSEQVPMLAQVHDEVVFEVLHMDIQVPTILHTIQRLFEEGHGFDLRVPLLFEPHYGTSWAHAKAGDEDLVSLFEDEEGYDDE